MDSNENKLSDSQPHQPKTFVASSSGLFDPLTFCLQVDEELIISNNSLPKAILNNSTYFHEAVHSWQLFAFTSGLLTASIRPIQSVLAPEFLRKKAKTLVKPIVKHFTTSQAIDQGYISNTIKWRTDTEEDVGMYMVHKYFFDFEKLNASLDDPKRFSRRESENQFANEAFPPNMHYYRGFESALLDLVSMIRQEMKSQFNGLAWPGKVDLINFINEVESSTFEPSKKWQSCVLGIADIQEGHARFLEMQLLAVGDKHKDDFNYFEQIKFLGKRYTKAYKLFLELTGLSASSNVTDWKVFLFIVTCEYALNPSVPYVDAFQYNLEELFDQFHPGQRFNNACKAISKLPKITPINSNFGDYMKSAFEIIEEASRPKWAPTLSEAFQSIASLAKKAKETQGFIGRGPVFNVVGRHFETVLFRSLNKDVYINPLIIALNGESVIKYLLPPIVKTRNDTAYISITGSSKQDYDIEQAGFFISHVYSDLVYQLLAKEGPFKYTYPMIPEGNYKELIVNEAKKVFQQYFGIQISNIRY